MKLEKTFAKLAHSVRTLSKEMEAHREMPVINRQVSAPKTVSGSLEPYSGAWGFGEAAHLLRRTLYGPTRERIEQAVADGLDGTIAALLVDRPMPDPPINYNYVQDSRVPVGETWVYKMVDPAYRNQIRNYRRRSLYAWTIDNMVHHGGSIVEKMTLFWHNHLPTAGFFVPNYMYKYYETLRKHATGNFRQLIKDITIDPLMLRYLDGRLNRKGSPNENYARELMELFVLDKGPVAGEGDYTTYTEQDVEELSKILTGWRDVGGGETEDGEPYGRFVLNRHDRSTKTLSHRLGNKVFEDAGEKEYEHLIDFLFEQEATAEFLARELYKWFVYYEINDHVRQEVIKPLAQIIRAHDYELKPALAALLGSTHFYDVQLRGAMIKNPMDFVLGLFVPFNIQVPSDLEERYNLMYDTYEIIKDLQMTWYNPPDVAGWKAYYQEPVFYQVWIDSVTLPLRQYVTNFMVSEGVIDVIEFMEGTSNPSDPNSLIADFGNVLLPRALTENQIDLLKGILIPGLPDFEWTEEYFIWKEDPENEEKIKTIKDKLNAVIQKILVMPEYYLM